MQDTNKQHTIVGTVEHIVFCNKENGYAVLDIETQDNELLTAVGTLSQLCVGESVKLYGFFKAHANFGMQFRVNSYEASLPQSVSAVLKYLESGALPYIGKATAKKIVSKFKDETLEVIATDAKSLSLIKGISLDKAIKIQQEFKSMFNIRETIVYFAQLGISADKAIEFYKIFGDDTIECIKINPYVLCGYPIYIDFAFVDKIAAEMLMEYNCSERIGAAILYILRHNLQNGHTCVPYNKLINVVSSFLNVEPEIVQENINYNIENKNISEQQTDQRNYIFLPEYLNAEYDIAQHLLDTVKLPSSELINYEQIFEKIENVNNIEYAPLQKEAISLAIKNNVLVLTGGPGTGKTTTVNGIITAFEHLGQRVSLAAPTGRAAKRLSELTNRKATTIHRLLEVDFSTDNIVRFIHNEKNMLKCDVVIIDEMSMVDVLLFQSLLCALKPRCKIILIGDEDQLPSVGAGNVLSSIVASDKIPTIRLKEIFRQAAQSDIVFNSHKIVNGEKLRLSGRNSDFFVLEQNNAEKCANLICELVSKRLPSSYKFNALEDIQVLCPTKIGPVGTAALNTMLQDYLNPPKQGKKQLKLQDKILRVGDKVMQTKNNYDIVYNKIGDDEEAAGAFNGDMGIIIDVSEKEGSVTVKSEDRIYKYTTEFVYELEIAYAVTIHKSQGSEFAAVILPILDVPPKLCYRNLLYTGVTRAKKLCIIAGTQSQTQQMINNSKQSKRFSCLLYFLNE